MKSVIQKQIYHKPENPSYIPVGSAIYHGSGYMNTIFYRNENGKRAIYNMYGIVRGGTGMSREYDRVPTYREWVDETFGDLVNKTAIQANFEKCG